MADIRGYAAVQEDRQRAERAYERGRIAGLAALSHGPRDEHQSLWRAGYAHAVVEMSRGLIAQREDRHVVFERPLPFKARLAALLRGRVRLQLVVRIDGIAANAVVDPRRSTLFCGRHAVALADPLPPDPAAPAPSINGAAAPPTGSAS